MAEVAAHVTDHVLPHLPVVSTALSGNEVAEWLRLSGRAAGPASSVVELVGQRRVEYEDWDWFGLGVKRLSCA